MIRLQWGVRNIGIDVDVDRIDRIREIVATVWTWATVFLDVACIEAFRQTGLVQPRYDRQNVAHFWSVSLDLPDQAPDIGIGYLRHN